MSGAGDVRRIGPADQRLRIELGHWLAEVAGQIAGDRFLDGPVTRALLVMWGPDGPFVTWHGRITETELRVDVQSAIREVTEPEGMRPSDNAARRAEHETALQAAKPHECRRKGGCGARFATERGRDAHEAAGQRAQDAEDRFTAELPLHAPAPKCYLPQGGTHCVCGVWPPDRRRPGGDWTHRYRPEPPPTILHVVANASEKPA